VQAWGAPPAAEFTLEVLKGGVVALTVLLSGRSHWLLGRHPGCDVALEHPSASRLHCCLQFRGDEAFAYDAGSAHGTFLNKRRLKPRVHAPLRVGDQLRFGQSSRVYVLTGPQALLPEEGLSKAERQQLRSLEAAAAAADDAAMRAMALVKARAAAGGGDGGVSWGQDASEAADYGEDDAPHRGGEIDWRTYTGKMNEKQEKAVEKLRKREATMANLASEIERITAKEGSQQGLTGGQSAQVARNEARMEVLRAEMEDAEEALNESLAESSAARAEAAAAGTGAGRAAAARKRRAAAEAEDAAAAGESDSDEFYDRTAAGGAKRARAAGPAADAGDNAGPAAAAAPAVDNAETLWAKRAAVQAQLGPAREAAAAAAAAAAEEAACAPAAGAADELDAYMAGVSSELGARAAAAAASDVASLESEEARLTRLLHLADPGGLYTGPRAVPPAPPSADKAAMAPPEARVAAAAAVAAVFGGRGEGDAAPAAPEGPDEDGFLAPAALRAQFSQRSALAAMEAALAGGGEAAKGGLLEVRRKPAPGAGAQQPARRRAADAPVLSGEELAAAAAASAADDVRRLLARGAGGVDDDAAGEEDDEMAAAAYAAQRAAWAPPQGQSGDGRTGGNARLGY
jgi:hypothetical protein